MSDDRFKALGKDPRYRLPNRKEARTAVDPRFGRLFNDQDFRKKASVDRYGRKVKAEAGTKELEKLYRLEKEEKEEEPKKIKNATEIAPASDDEEDSSEDDEEQVAARRDPARDGGFEESSSEEESSDEESDAEIELAELTAGQEEAEDIPMGEVSKRIAVVNLDWDNIRAADILAVASSFAPSGGHVINVTVYPSEFGRERMEQEELHGPPKEIFASSKDKSEKKAAEKVQDDEEDDSEDDPEDDEKIRRKLIAEQANEGEEFDTAKLRQYQLDRLRYYYAVITCDGNGTAKFLYDSMDGREYLSTANFFDMRFIPDETSFEGDKQRDECSSLPSNYKPNDFRTEALTHSKVRLTWDDDDTTRKEVQKRAFSRAEIDENDLQAYIGSDSSDAESTTSRKSTTTPEERKASKKEAQRMKMRAALGLGGESTKRSKDEPVGDMQITFTSGLTSDKKDNKGVFENEPQDEESTRARYIRKERERKQQRKDRNKASKSGADEDEDAADAKEAAPADEEVDSAEDDPFNDPFFNDPAAAAQQEKKMRKAERLQKREARNAAEAEAASRRAELELLMADDNGDKTRHFDMRDVEKAEKLAKKKGKKSKKPKVQDATDDAEKFEVETKDPRFAALFDSHEYAIDPTNPRFKGTEGMKALLEEGRKKRKRDGRDGDDGEEEPAPAKGSKKGKKAETAGDDDELKGLVARLKGKNKKSK